MMILPADFPAIVNTDVLTADGQFITRAALNTEFPVLACAAFDIDKFHPSLFDEFRIPCPPALRRAARKRRAEYLASRWLVREIAERYAVDNFILTNNNQRAPCWPSAFSGSLSHTAGVVFLLTDSDKRLAGNDVEHWMTKKVADETHSILMDDAEKTLIRLLTLPWEQATTLLFSLKESLYKALWPDVRQYIDFLQVRLLAVDEKKQTARLQIEETLSASHPQGSCFNAQFALTEQRVFTWICQ